MNSAQGPLAHGRGALVELHGLAFAGHLEPSPAGTTRTRPRRERSTASGFAGDSKHELPTRTAGNGGGLIHTPTAWGPWDPMSLTSLAALFDGFHGHWWVAGGHAIELACRRRVRDHGDIDVLVLRRDQSAIQDLLADWQWWAADPPGVLRRWEPGEVLHAAVHDIWCRRASHRPWALQIMLDESAGDTWISRRNPSVRRPITRIGLRNHDGIPYLAPEIQLYYKAKDIRPKDSTDLDAVLPFLQPAQRRWLDHALTTTYGPDHPWIGVGRPNRPDVRPCLRGPGRGRC